MSVPRGLQFVLAFALGIDATGHAISLYLRYQGMRPMWVSEPASVPVVESAQESRLTVDDQHLASFGNLQRPHWRCPVHGDIVSDVNITVSGMDGPHHYCPRCIVELLDRMVTQVEPIPQAEEGAR